MRSSLPALMTEDQLSAVKAALTAAAAGNPCGEEQAARYEMLLDELLEEWGATSLRQLPASSFRHVLNWCAQQSLPDERGKFERHAQAALDDLKAAAHALHEYREALRGVRAVAGELLPLLMGRLSLPGMRAVCWWMLWTVNLPPWIASWWQPKTGEPAWPWACCGWPVVWISRRCANE